MPPPSGAISILSDPVLPPHHENHQRDQSQQVTTFSIEYPTVSKTPPNQPYTSVMSTHPGLQLILHHQDSHRSTFPKVLLKMLEALAIPAPISKSF